MIWLTNLLERKGVWCTFLGLMIAIFSNIPPLIDHWNRISLSQDYLIQTIGFNVIAIIFIILPSKVIIEFLKGKFIVED